MSKWPTINLDDESKEHYILKKLEEAYIQKCI